MCADSCLVVRQVSNRERGGGHERIFLGENVTSGVSFLIFLRNMDRLAAVHQRTRGMVCLPSVHNTINKDLMTCAQRRHWPQQQGECPVYPEYNVPVQRRHFALSARTSGRLGQ